MATLPNDPPFGFVPIEPRRSQRKPRRTGLSMVIDDGLPLSYLRSVLEIAAPYIDLLKIKTGTARLYPRAALVDKLALCAQFEIRPFVGGHSRVCLRDAGRHRAAALLPGGAALSASAPSRSPTTPCR